MKEFGERAAGSTALLHWWNEAELRQRPHSPARLRALRYGAWPRKPAASRTRLAVEACWNPCIPVAPSLSTRIVCFLTIVKFLPIGKKNDYSLFFDYSQFMLGKNKLFQNYKN